MPIDATPTPFQTPATCTSPNTLVKQTTEVDGVPNPKKLYAFTVTQGQKAVLTWQMLDQYGCPVNLTTCGGPVVLRLREIMSIGDVSSSGLQLACDPVDPANGVVDCQLNADAVAYAGISRGEFGATNSEGDLIFSNDILLIVNRSQWGLKQIPLGPPTLPEIRLHLRDSAPVDNLWLGVNEFDDAEIAACITRPIEYFNEAPPPLGFQYNTANFQWRYNWLNAIVACLYQMASLHYARVHLKYQAGGNQIDDKAKFEEYSKIGQQKWDEFKQWVTMKKVQLNAEQAYMITGSGYDSRFGGW